MIKSIFSIGIDHNSADLNLRGRFAMTKKFLGEFCNEAHKLGGLQGIIGIMTCNRNEFYLYCDESFPKEFIQLLQGKLDLGDRDLEHIFIIKERDSLQRIFRVAAGFESVITGEDQILGQVITAMEEAIALKCSCGVLNKIFNDAIRCAKEIKSQTGVSENKISVASIGVSLLEENKNGFRDKTAMIIGFGDMAKLAATYLSEKGIKKMIVASRSKESLSGFVCEAELEWVPYESRDEAVKDVDIIVSATGAPHIVFKKEEFVARLEKEDFFHVGKTLSILDMAVPRDIDQGIGEIEGVSLFDMDDFKRISDENLEYRKKLLIAQEFRVGNYIREFEDWYQDQNFHKLFSRIDKYVENNVSNQAESLLYKLELDGETLESEEVMDYGKKLSERVLKNLVLKAKKLPKDKADIYVSLLGELL